MTIDYTAGRSGASKASPGERLQIGATPLPVTPIASARRPTA